MAVWRRPTRATSCRLHHPARLEPPPATDSRRPAACTCRARCESLTLVAEGMAFGVTSSSVSADRLAFGRLRRADHPPVGVVQLPRLGQLALAANGGVQPAQVGQCRSEGESVQDLRHPRADRAGRRLLRAPIAGGQRVLQAIGDGLVLYGRDRREVGALVHGLLAIPLHVLGQLAEELPEQLAEEGPGQVEPLLGVVVAVVGPPGADGGHEKLVDDVADEVGLLGLVVRGDADVWQHLALQDLRRRRRKEGEVTR
eukprot:scaffold15837_cov99-Isochrysis_galbana.AAC.5